MFGKKLNLIVGLTTYNNELLRISIPALGNTGNKFLLVIYNDNPAGDISRRQIRKMGYHGPLHIINGMENVDALRARMAITEYVSHFRKLPEWIIFQNDNDILTNTDLPDVGADVYAVMQNAVSVRRRVADLFFAIENPGQCEPDGINTVLVRPNVGICGILVRFNIMLAMVRVLMAHTDTLTQIESDMTHRPSYDAIMHACLTAYVREAHPDMVAIYMDKTNYITCDLDTDTIKSPVPADIMARYMAIFAPTTGDTAAIPDAAPRGTE